MGGLGKGTKRLVWDPDDRSRSSQSSSRIVSSNVPPDMCDAFKNDLAPNLAPNYVSKLPYVKERIFAAAMYCSDGRVGDHFDDFMQTGLRLPRYDRLALPGGPACLAGYSAARLEEEGVIDELEFLVTSHKLSRIVLIQHEGCAFYENRLKVRPQSIEQLQKADLVRAAYTIRHWVKIEQIEGYFLKRTDEGMIFEQVRLD